MIERDTLLRIFDIDLDAGKMFWRVAPRTHPRLAGTEAGSVRRSHSGKHYCVVKINGFAHKRGHLIFFLANGFWAKPCLDHINGNSLDDSRQNLRQATVLENCWNHKKRAKASPLPMGVRQLPDSARYQARIACRGKSITIGTFETTEEAHLAYLEKRGEFYGQFA